MNSRLKTKMSRRIFRIPAIAARGIFEGQKAKWFPTITLCRALHAGPPLEYVPRRALMYIPGSDERKLAKIPSLGCDCAVMDMEDGVAQNRKLEARQYIVNALSTVDFSNVRDIAVRVNSVSSGLAEDDLIALSKAEKLPMTIMLPKLDTLEEALWFSSTMSCIFKNGNKDQPFRLVVFTESANGLLDLKDLLTRMRKLSCIDNKEGAPYVLEGVVFGSDDFCASIGATRTAEAKELLYARQKVVLVAKSFNLQAIDLVHIDYKDLQGLKTYSEEGARMGFTGKQVIHPGQVEIVQKAFTPSVETRNWANDLIKAFKEHQESGLGAFNFQNKMIDMPLLRQAQNIVAISKNMKV